MPNTRDEGPVRRARLTAEIQAATGIDDAVIECLVRRFYDRVRADPLLGPVFAARIADWEPHLQRMFAFWSSVTLMTGRYSGDPMGRHATLPVDAAHFARWLALWQTTAEEVCPPAAAARFVEAARRIARSLLMGLSHRHGVLPGAASRFTLPEPGAVP